MFFFLHNCVSQLAHFLLISELKTYTQLSAKVSKNGVLFFGFVDNSTVGCLNEHQPIQRQSIVSNCGYFLIFFSSYIFFQSLLFNVFFSIVQVLIFRITVNNSQIHHSSRSQNLLINLSSI